MVIDIESSSPESISIPDMSIVDVAPAVAEAAVPDISIDIVGVPDMLISMLEDDMVIDIPDISIPVDVAAALECVIVICIAEDEVVEPISIPDISIPDIFILFCLFK